MFVSVPKMMSDGQYLGRLSSRYISHSGKHVGHRLDLDKFGKLGARDDCGAALGHRSAGLRRVAQSAK